MCLISSCVVGWLFGCSDYPAPHEIQNAPSICLLGLIQKVLPVLYPTPAAYFGNIRLGLYKDICQDNCYQNYVRSANQFLNLCYSDLKQTNNSLLQLYALNAFNGNSCGN